MKIKFGFFLYGIQIRGQAPGAPAPGPFPEGLGPTIERISDIDAMGSESTTHQITIHF